MTHFVIAGIPTCVMFNHVRLIADVLSKRFPNFKARFITLDSKNWKPWLEKKNIENGWYHLESPIIWKELTMQAGTPHLIGGASEFWEYCYDYYNLESLLDNEDLNKLVADSQQYEDKKQEYEEMQEARKQYMIICVSSNGPQGDVLPILIQQLIDIAHIFHPRKVIIRLLKEDNITAEDVEELCMSHIDFELAHTLYEGLIDADLILLVGDYTREEDENFYSWLNRNRMAMEYVAYAMNNAAKESVHVIVGMHGPCCFNAAILMENVNKINIHNIVAETSSVGLEALSLVSKVTEMPIEDLHGPPVWGFIGVNQIIDLEHIVQRYHVYRPNKRAVNNNYNSTLELGTTHSEYRYLAYLADKLKNVWFEFKKKRELSGKFSTKTAKIRSIINIIYNWYSSEFAGNIISLGVLSNGSFGIPPGIVFSQPVTYKSPRWIPVNIYTMPRKDPCGVEDLVPFVRQIYKYFRLTEFN